MSLPYDDTVSSLYELRRAAVSGVSGIDMNDTSGFDGDADEPPTPTSPTSPTSPMSFGSSAEMYDDDDDSGRDRHEFPSPLRRYSTAITIASSHAQDWQQDSDANSLSRNASDGHAVSSLSSSLTRPSPLSRRLHLRHRPAADFAASSMMGHASFDALGHSNSSPPRETRSQPMTTFGSLQTPDSAKSSDQEGPPSPGHNERQPLLPPPADDGDRLSWKQATTSLIFGAINSIIVAPVVVAYAQIIFSHQFFAPSLPYLVKLVWFSSVVHQLIFTSLSSLPFAVGQVQDAGLIFLSQMASDIVNITTKKGASRSEVMASVLCWLALSTATLGLAVWITGRLKLASLVQYLPVPVVGGYLAYIGFFCFEAGVALMAGFEVTSITDFKKMTSWQSYVLVVPGLVFGLLLVVVSRKFKHFAVLPVTLLAIPAGFYIVLAASGTSMDEARQALGSGWVGPRTSSTHFWEVWEHFEFAKVHWSACAQQIPTWIAMYIVVTFSSCLDVAAIQMELGKPLDFNHELQTVGISNLCSGVTGGFTGSYIFSQTLFTMRAGVRSRLAGIVIIVCCLAFFMIPVSILSVTPKFFFGAVLIFIALDLMSDWLWDSYFLMTKIEYVIVWLTFIAINAINNLEYGFLIGLGCCLLLFVFQYSRVDATKRVYRTSNVRRNLRHRKALAGLRRSIVTLELNGYIFFGSGVRILREVEQAVLIPTDKFVECQAQQQAQQQALPKTFDFGSEDHDEESSDQDDHRFGRGQQARSHKHADSVVSLSKKGRPIAAVPTKFVILDFKGVQGVDATATRTCFLTLIQTLSTYNIQLVMTQVPPSVFNLLQSNGVFNELCEKFPTLDEGLEYCEDRLLRSLLARRPRSLNNQGIGGIAGIMAECLSEEGLAVRRSALPDLSGIEKYFHRRVCTAGEIVFNAGEMADRVYFVETGSVVLLQPVAEDQEATKKGPTGPAERSRVRQYSENGVFGEMNFFLRTQRQFEARALQQTVVWAMTWEDFAHMQAETPNFALDVQAVLLKSTCLSLSNHNDAIYTQFLK
eukprot:m.281611 g.281611  ORF g.281611 m.281611 type:complete len:1038 (-) comp19404_c0_seq9:16-3129(-)